MTSIAAIALLAWTDGVARADGPSMWGAGPNLSTIAFPGRYPGWFPKETQDELSDYKVRGDLGIGARGSMYMSKSQRIGALIQFGFGGGYGSSSIVGLYDLIYDDQGGVGVFAGGGGGFGTLSFSNDAGDQLKMATYIIRGEAGAYFRDRTRAYEIATCGNLVLPGVQRFTPDGADEETEVSGGGYLYLGIEGTVYFGDFTPAKEKGGGGKSGRKGGRRGRS